MQLQEQVISLEQATKIHKLWFEMDSYFMIYDDNDLELHHTVIEKRYVKWHLDNICDFRHPAYTVSELIEILPATIKNDKVGIELNIQITKLDWLYYISYRDEWNTAQEWHEKNKNLTIALWDMLIYLLENNLLPTTTNE